MKDAVLHPSTHIMNNVSPVSFSPFGVLSNAFEAALSPTNKDNRIVTKVNPKALKDTLFSPRVGLCF